MDITALVKKSAKFICSKAKHVKLNEGKIKEFAKELSSKKSTPASFAACEFHYSSQSDPELLANYVFVLDCMNFCFWQSKYSYAHLAEMLKVSLNDNSDLFKFANMCEWNMDTMNKIFPEDFPMKEQRLFSITQLANTVKENGYTFVSLVESCGKNGATLAEKVASFGLTFQDHAVYHSQQVFFYKRAQILVADLWGAFEGKSLGEFSDISSLTCFADYMLPKYFQGLGIMEYSPQLESTIKEMGEIKFGSEEEIELRGLTIMAVSEICDELEKLGSPLSHVEIDWLIWQNAEERKNEYLPHHRVLTVYY